MCTMLRLHLLPPVPCSRHLHSISNFSNGLSAPNFTRTASLVSTQCYHRISHCPRQIETCSLHTVSRTSVLGRHPTHLKCQDYRSRLPQGLTQWTTTSRGRQQSVSASATAAGAAGSGDQTIMPSSSTTHNELDSLGDNAEKQAVYVASSSVAGQPIPLQMRLQQMAPVDQAFLLLGFIACLTTGVLTAVLMTAIPTLNAMRRAAVAMEKLAEVAREELPSTMAAVRLSGMEISDLTLELNDLREDLSSKEFNDLKNTIHKNWSHEISDGVKSSTRAVQAAEVGMRRMGALAATQTISMLQERANVPVDVVKPAMLSAAQRTRQAMEVTQKMVVTLISHPRLAGWLGQLIAKKEEKSSPEIIPEVTSDAIAAAILSTVEEPSEEGGPEIPDASSAQK